MKMKGKTCFLMFCVLALLSVYAVGIVAYMTSFDSVNNVFTIGKVKIRLDESKVDYNGRVVEGAERVLENKYSAYPGETYIKDPMVTVLKGSSECYVRMFMTINEQKELDGVLAAEEKTLIDMFHGYDAEKWNLYSERENGDNTRTYEFRYYKTVNALNNENLELEPLFTSFTLPTSLTKENLSTLNRLEISVVAHAVQAGSFDDAEDAWNVFENQDQV